RRPSVLTFPVVCADRLHYGQHDQQYSADPCQQPVYRHHGVHHRSPLRIILSSASTRAAATSTTAVTASVYSPAPISTPPIPRRRRCVPWTGPRPDCGYRRLTRTPVRPSTRSSAASWETLH